MEKFSYGEIKILVCRTIWAPAAVSVGFSSQIFYFAFFGKKVGCMNLRSGPQVHCFSFHLQSRGRVGRSGREGFTHLFYTDKSLLFRIAMVSCCCNALIFFCVVTLLNFVLLFWCYDLWWLDEICGESLLYFVYLHILIAWLILLLDVRKLESSVFWWWVMCGFRVTDATRLA